MAKLPDAIAQTGATIAVPSRAPEPTFAQREDLLEVIIAELEAERLVEGSSKVMMSGSSIMNQHSTRVGRTFLEFIGTPASLQNE